MTWVTAVLLLLLLLLRCPSANSGVTLSLVAVYQLLLFLGWTEQKEQRERVKQGTAAFFFPFLSGNVADVHFPMW